MISLSDSQCQCVCVYVCVCVCFPCLNELPEHVQQMKQEGRKVYCYVIQLQLEAPGKLYAVSFAKVDQGELIPGIIIRLQLLPAPGVGSAVTLTTFSFKEQTVNLLFSKYILSKADWLVKLFFCFLNAKLFPKRYQWGDWGVTTSVTH